MSPDLMGVPAKEINFFWLKLDFQRLKGFFPKAD
jgi:hypothetical protein